MKVDWDQSVAGLSLVEIRNLLRYVARSDKIFTEKSVAIRLGPKQNDWTLTSEEVEAGKRKAKIQARRLMVALAASGILKEPNGEKIRIFGPERDPGYGLTPAGFGLLRAKKTKRITREAANNAVEQLRKAIFRINSDPFLMYDVEKICIYGSYLTETEDLGDVDVGYRLRRRWADDEEYQRMKEAFELIYEPPESQRDVYDYQYHWRENVVLKMLRPKACIQLTEMEYVEDLGCPMIEIHPRECSIAAKNDYVFDRGEIRLVEDNGWALAHLNEKIRQAVDAQEKERKARQGGGSR